MLVILSGSSGAGKDTIKKELLKLSSNISTFPAITSREPRGDEVPGEAYIYVATEEFEDMIKSDELYEYSNHHGNYYGTSKKVINEKLSEGKILVKDIDVNGTQDLMELLSKDTKFVTIYLKVAKEVLRERLENRGDKDIDKRLDRYEYEQSKQGMYDYIIPNNDMNKTVDIIMTIIESEYKYK
jgi:Guanylate kinase